MRPPTTILLAGVLATLFAASQDDSTFATKGYPQDMVSAARLTEHRCTKCHTIGRVVEADYVGAEWAPVVEQMAKKEKSGINAQDAATIAKFLSYRSTRKGGEGDGGASRPASRPTTFGGVAAWPVPAHTIYASALLEASAALPATIDLLGLAVQVKEAAAISNAGTTSRASVRVAVGDREQELMLTHDASDAWSSEILTLRTWTIGPHSFRFALAIFEADLSFEGSRPGIRIATIVVRSTK